MIRINDFRKETTSHIQNDIVIVVIRVKQWDLEPLRFN